MPYKARPKDDRKMFWGTTLVSYPLIKMSTLDSIRPRWFLRPSISILSLGKLWSLRDKTYHRQLLLRVLFTVKPRFCFLKKYGPNQASFCLFSSFSQYNDKYWTVDYKWKKCRWRAWDSNPELQDGRPSLFCFTYLNAALKIWPATDSFLFSFKVLLFFAVRWEIKHGLNYEQEANVKMMWLFSFKI